MSELTSKHSCLSICVDDIVVRGYDHELAQTIRQIIERSARTVQGKVRYPNSSIIYTVNAAHASHPAHHCPSGIP